MTIRNALLGRGPRMIYAAAFTAGTGLAVLSAAPAHAAGTLADTLVSNTVTLTYSVGGVEQTDNPTSTADFEVDRMIDVQVAGQTSPAATPGDTEGVLIFTLENQGNAPQGYDLTAVNGSNFTPTEIWIDADNDGAFDPAVDTLFTGSNYPQLGPDENIEIFIIGTVDPSLADGDTIAADLVATTLEPTGSPYGTAGAVVAESTTTTILGVDTIFVDDNFDGTYSADVAEDGVHSDQATATVAKAALTVEKTVEVISYSPDGQCATMAQAAIAEQAAIPGACIEYTLAVSNAASPAVGVEDVLITDVLPAQVSFVAFIGDISGFSDEVADGDVAPAETGGTVTATEATIAPGETVTLRIRALIN